MIRVLQVLATLKRAGAERMAVSLACGLDRARFAPALVSLYDPFPGGLEPELERCGVPVWHLGKRRGFDPRMYRRLAAVVEQFRPDIVHTHSYVMRYTLPLAARVKVHTVHNIASREVDAIGRWIHRWAYSRGTMAVAVGREVAGSFRDLYGRNPDAVIPNGVAVEAFHPGRGREQWRAAHGFTTKDMLIVSVARLEPQKNPQLLAGAFARLNQGHLLLIGQGSLAAGLSGRERVHLLGPQSDVAQILQACDLFALASDWEGYPLAVIEAMAAGLPVIATRVGGMPEIVEHEHTGLLVPARDPNALVAALERLTRDPALRHSMGEAARERAVCFGVNRMVQAYAGLFERALG